MNEFKIVLSFKQLLYFYFLQFAARNVILTIALFYFYSLLPEEQGQVAQTVGQTPQHCGDATATETPSATLADSTTNSIT